MSNKRYRSKVIPGVGLLIQNMTLFLIIGIVFNYWQPAWADVDDDILRGVENKLGQIKEVNHKPHFESWIKSANEIDNLIKKKCSLSILSKGLSKNCTKLRDTFIEKSEKVLKKYSELEKLTHSDLAYATKLHQRVLKIFSYGRNQEEKQEETKHSHLEPLAHQDCDKPNLPFNPKEMEVCWPQEAKDTFGLVLDYASNNIELKSFKECAQLDKNKLVHLNIRFSEKMKNTIIAILNQLPPVEDLLSDFEGMRPSFNSTQSGNQEEKQPQQVQSARAALRAHIKAYPNHLVEKNWEDIKGCFSKLKVSQAAGRGVRGIDLDFTNTPYDGVLIGYVFTGEKAVDILEQYFISKNLKTITIKALTGKTLERFFDLLAHKQVQLDFLKIGLGNPYREGEITHGLKQLRNALLEGRLVVKHISLMEHPHRTFIDEYNKELVQLIANPNNHLDGLDITLDPRQNRGIYVAVGNAIKRNNTLKSIRIVENHFSSNPEDPESFIEGLKENHSIQSVEVGLDRFEDLRSHEVQDILNAFNHALDINETLTDLKVNFGLWHDDHVTTRSFRGKYVLHVYNGKLIGTENAKGHKQFTSLEAFPVEMRPVIQEILVKLNRNAQNALKKERGETVSEEKEEKKSEEHQPHYSNKKSGKNSIHGLDE